MTNRVPRARWQDERGTTIVIVTLFMTTLFGFAALSIDVSHVFQEQRRAQIAADAGSFAAAVLLTNSPQVKADIIQEAQNVAATNGLTAQEIAASSVGQIQVGQWNPTNNIFTPDASPYNAVRVPASRTVPVMFGKVVGMSQMTPAVKSVTALTGAGEAVNVIPWGAALSYVQNAQIGDTITVWGGNGGTSPGNTGALNLNGNIGNPHDWLAAMEDPNACNCTVSVSDQQTSMRPGIPNWDATAWDYRIQNGYTLVTMPVVQQYANGSQSVIIVGFIRAQLLSVTSGGVPHFSGTFKVLSALFGGEGGGPPGGPFAQARVLVQ